MKWRNSELQQFSKIHYINKHIKEYIDGDHNLNSMEISEENEENKEYKTSAKNQVCEKYFSSIMIFLIVINYSLKYHGFSTYQSFLYFQYVAAAVVSGIASLSIGTVLGFSAILIPQLVEEGFLDSDKSTESSWIGKNRLSQRRKEFAQNYCLKQRTVIVFCCIS